ncbi:hypothetical protein [Streptomyces similanensis]|uniref:hypothetical protein n=1 Tax=Streptomyces similanensis TaxID=1274988 RepID=UPI0031EE1BF7
MNVIPDPDHPDTADTLEAMRDEHLVLARAMHSAPGADHWASANLKLLVKGLV